MRKVLISIAAAGAALAVASPAAAQYYPQQPQSYGYTNGGYTNGGYGNGGYGQQYGYNGYGQNNYGQLRALQARIDAVQYRINQMSRYTGGRGQTQRLREASRNIERQLHQAARNGLNPYEANQIQYRIAQLEQRVQYGMGNRYGGYGNGQNGYGNGTGYNNRDRDDDHRGYGDRDDDHDDD